MISLMKYIGGKWEECRGYLKLDLDHLQEAYNNLEARLLTGKLGSNTLNPTIIQGSPTPVPRYVASTGAGNAPKWDQVDLASTGIKNRLPYAHLHAATAASLLLGRGSAAGAGDWEEISLDATSIRMVGTVLQALGGGSSSRQLWQYKAKTSATSGYPGDGYMLWDNATQTSATHLLFSHLTSDDLDIDLFLAFINTGTTIVLQDANTSGNNQVWLVTGTPVNTNPGLSNSYWTIPVSLTSSAGTGTTGFPNNHQLIAAIFSPQTSTILTPLTVDPPSPVNGTVWLFDDGGTPASLSMRWRKGGVTYDFPIGTAT